MKAPNTTKHGLLARLGALTAALRRRHDRRAAYRALAALDDRTLQDIGIARENIWTVVDSALDARTAQQGTLAGERHTPGLPAAGHRPAGAPANDTDSDLPRHPLAA